jgi:ABC-type dipeptide/oligopeptide/nickel transport system permease subunit
VSAAAAAAAGLTARVRPWWSRALVRLVRQPAAVGAFVVLVGLLVTGALAPQIAPQRWNAIDLASRWENHAPTFAAGHWLGTDNIGRDTLVRTLWGLHYIEQTALAGALIATVLGLVVGGVAGYYGGWLDAVLMRLADLVTGLPVFVLMLITFAFLEPVTIWKATIVFGLYMWTSVARAIRARVASLAHEEFALAARALGGSDLHIFFRHLLPNAAGAVAVAATSAVGQIVLVEATVEFFGFGVVSLVRPTLGNLIAEGAASGIGSFNYLGLGWWVWATPATVLVVVLVCVNLVGDGLGEILDPRARRR